MKNLKLNIEKSTLRELDNIELNEVAGGNTWVWWTNYVTRNGDDDDVIFDDGFDAEP